VTFNETIPCSSPVFESAGDQEIVESIFDEDDVEDANWGDPEPTPLATPLECPMTTLSDGPDPFSSTTWGPFEQPTQPRPIIPEEAQAAVEGEATSSREHLDTFSFIMHLRT
jgi:hypothetical protein